MSAATKRSKAVIQTIDVDDAAGSDMLVRDFFADSDDEGLSVSAGTGLHPPVEVAANKKHASPRPGDDDDDEIEILLDVKKGKKLKGPINGDDSDIEIFEPPITSRNAATSKAPVAALPLSSKSSLVCKPSSSKAAQQDRMDDDEDDEEPTDEIDDDDDACDFGFDNAFSLDDARKALPPVVTKGSGDCCAGLTGHAKLLGQKMAALQKTMLDADFKEMHHRNFLECQNKTA